MARPRFNCDCCGFCCRSIGGIQQLVQYDRGDGVCCHLTDANLCDIYESRPEVCNVEKMYPKVSAEMSREEYYTLMEESCKLLKDRFRNRLDAAKDREDMLRLLRHVPPKAAIMLMSETAPSPSRLFNT